MAIELLDPLTIKAIKGPDPGKKVTRHNDGGGLWLRVTKHKSKNGVERVSKSWEFFFTLNSKTTCTGLGPFAPTDKAPGLTLAAARDEAYPHRHVRNRPMTAPNTDTGQRGNAFSPTQLVPNALLRTKDVCAVTGMARPTLYEAMAAQLWPRPIKLGAKSSAWPATEVNAMLAARVRGASIDEIKALVVTLTDARQHCA